MQKHIQHNKDEQTQFFRKIYLSLYLKGFERVTKGIICERWVGDWTELQHVDPHSSDPSSISFPFSWDAQPGAWGPSLCWDMVLIPASSLQRIWTSGRRGYIIICVHLLLASVTFEFNTTRRQSRLSPDPLISSTGCTGAFLIWQHGRVIGQYFTVRLLPSPPVPSVIL